MKRVATHLAAWVLLAAVPLGSPALLAQVFDAPADFSATDNPNQVWSYGWSDVPGGQFALYVDSSQRLGLDAWSRNGTDQPSVLHNGTNQPIVLSAGLTVYPGQLVLHPGREGENCVLRWTAPTSGAFEVEAEFQLIDVQARTVDAHIYRGSSSLFSRLLSGFGDLARFGSTLSVAAGESVDFVVGLGTEAYTDDSVSITLTISKGHLPAPAFDTGWRRCDPSSGRGRPVRLRHDLGVPPEHLIIKTLFRRKPLLFGHTVYPRAVVVEPREVAMFGLDVIALVPGCDPTRTHYRVQIWTHR